EADRGDPPGRLPGLVPVLRGGHRTRRRSPGRRELDDPGPGGAAERGPSGARRIAGDAAAPRRPHPARRRRHDLLGGGGAGARREPAGRQGAPAGAARDVVETERREPPARPRRLRALAVWATHPIVRMWDSHDPLDAYGLAHMASAAGDALVALALADSVFFSIKPNAARAHVALYLGLTMAPLAVAGPLLVPLLDRGGFRRAISFCAADGRAAL